MGSGLLGIYKALNIIEAATIWSGDFFLWFSDKKIENTVQFSSA